MTHLALYNQPLFYRKAFAFYWVKLGGIFGSLGLWGSKGPFAFDTALVGLFGFGSFEMDCEFKGPSILKMGLGAIEVAQGFLQLFPWVGLRPILFSLG